MSFCESNIRRDELKHHQSSITCIKDNISTTTQEDTFSEIFVCHKYMLREKKLQLAIYYLSVSIKLARLNQNDHEKH